MSRRELQVRACSASQSKVGVVMICKSTYPLTGLYANLRYPLIFQLLRDELSGLGG